MTRSHRQERARTRRARSKTEAQPDALAIAIEQEDWERTALLLALGLTTAVRMLPQATIDDVLALLSGDEEAE